MDYVLNHTGKGNVWFAEAKKGPASDKYGWFLFSGNPAADVAAGKFPMLSGYNAGEWHDVTVGDIGYAVSKYAHSKGYSVVRELGGHGVGLEFHEDPFVAHIGKRGTGMVLVPGMVFTIEPMINMGTWKVFIDADDPYGWEVITEDEEPSAQWEHTLVMTEHGVEILTY
jgi:methionine aminopeptidase